MADFAVILGGARSGKSAFAERWLAARAEAKASDQLVYIATAQAGDDEMAARIAHHRERRGDGWLTVEEPVDLAGALDAVDWRASRGVLVDCLTLWLTNLLLADREIASDIDALIDALARAPGPVGLVSNEVGLGIVPENALARRFRDWQGRLNQKIAAKADTVVFMAAGLPMWLKGSGSIQGA